MRARAWFPALTMAALIGLTAGCAGSVAPSGTPAAAGARLSGAWRGSFWQVNAGDTGHIHGDVALQVNEDGTYTGVWSTRQVAGSARASRSEMSGTARVDGDRVVLEDWRRVTLKRVGDELYGIMTDAGSGRTVAVHLTKVPESR